MAGERCDFCTKYYGYSSTVHLQQKKFIAHQVKVLLARWYRRIEERANTSSKSKSRVKEKSYEYSGSTVLLRTVPCARRTVGMAGDEGQKERKTGTSISFQKFIYLHHFFLRCV